MSLRLLLSWTGNVVLNRLLVRGRRCCSANARRPQCGSSFEHDSLWEQPSPLQPVKQLPGQEERGGFRFALPSPFVCRKARLRSSHLRSSSAGHSVANNFARISVRNALAGILENRAKELRRSLLRRGSPILLVGHGKQMVDPGLYAASSVSAETGPLSKKAGGDIDRSIAALGREPSPHATRHSDVGL